MTPQNGGKNSKNITVWVLDVLGNEWPVPTTSDDDVIGVLIVDVDAFFSTRDTCAFANIVWL